MESSPVGWLCLIPPVLTIVLAILSKRVVASLLAGIAVAVIILLPSARVYGQVYGDEFSWATFFQGSFLQFLHELFAVHLWDSLVNDDHVRVFIFTSLLGMQIAIIHRMGGMLGIVQFAAPLARTRRGGQLLTWLLGLVIFIDDYANTLLLGSTMRPLTDRLKISREKLAFLVDSTAAPVSGLALVSTWVATEISNMQAGFENAGVDVGSSTFSIFIQTIPYRFYILFCLAFVFLCGLVGRDFGPMLEAERNSLSGGTPSDEETATRDKANDEDSLSGVSSQVRGRALNAVIPIVVTVVVVVAGLVFTGMQAEGLSTEQLPLMQDIQAWGQIIGQGDSYNSLIYGALAGLASVLLLNWSQQCLEREEVEASLISGWSHVVPALVVLWLAWALSRLTEDQYLGTGSFLASNITEFGFHPGFMPTIVFLLSAFIAFSTGTSWGTMGIVLPMTVPVVYKLLQADPSVEVAPDHFLILGSVGSVLAGAIFGDHCSPISDTTILSSKSSSCDHIAHVKTQMPYALVVGGVSIVFGTIPAGFGVSTTLLLVGGIGALIFVLLAFGRNPKPHDN